jgi:hypothetical protein
MKMADEPYWEISGPRKYLNIPSPVPDRWRAAMTYGEFPNYKTVTAWGPTEAAAREAAQQMATVCD